MAIHKREAEGRIALGVLGRIYSRPVFQQELDRRAMTSDARQHQGGIALRTTISRIIELYGDLRVDPHLLAPTIV